MILRILFFTILIFTNAFAGTQSLEEINADLLAKKKEIEPFDPSKVKIDLESLGLDSVDNKNDKSFNQHDLPDISKKTNDNSTIESIKIKEPSPIVKQDNLKKTFEVPSAVKTTLEKVEDVTSKIKEAVPLEKRPEVEKLEEKKQPEVVENKTEKQSLETDKKKPIIKDGDEIPMQNSKIAPKKYINAKKQHAIKRRANEEKIKKENAKKQEEKLRKFNELKQKYLNEIGEIDSISTVDNSEKIVPRKKDLNPFLNEELPALPILNRYRTQDNKHIPIVLTAKERVDLLFTTISANDIAAFNEAYKDIKNPNIKNSFGDTILTYAILLRRYPIIASIIDKGADVNMPNKLGYTPLNIAIEMSDFKSFEMLADNKADLDYLDAFGRSYLMQAARVGLLSAADLLVSRGADVNLMDDDGFTALSIAYRYKRELIVQYLLKQGAKPWIEKPYDPKSNSLIEELENRWK